MLRSLIALKVYYWYVVVSAVNFVLTFMATAIDAYYTSQACPCCGHTSRDNRPNKGLTFVCQQCGYTLHADLVGARNVALRVLLSRQDWESTGRFSAVPDASSEEASCERLSRYSQLRWTIDAIPTLKVAESFQDVSEARR